VPPKCTICFHDRRNEIDAELAAGTSYRNIAERFGTSLAALNRHKAHVARSIVKASERREERLGDSLLDQMERVQSKAWELLANTEAQGDNRAAIIALREVRECLQSLGVILAKAKAEEALPEDEFHFQNFSDVELETFERLTIKATAVQ
jgi:transposase